VRQRGNPHSGGDHLDQQQRIIDALKLRANPGRLQKMAPDIQATALYRVDKQRFAGDIFRCHARSGRQRVFRREDETHLIIEHRGIVQAAAWQNIGGQDHIQLPLL